MIHSKHLFLLFGLSSFALTTACKKDEHKSGGAVRSEFKSSKVSAAALREASLALSETGAQAQLLDSMGYAGTADLESLSYAVSGVSFCGHLVTKGTATSCQGNTWELYSNTGLNYDTFGPTDALNNSTAFVNFMDPNSVKTLGGSASYSDRNKGTYDSVLVYWYRPFKVKAKMTLNDGTVLYTKASTNFRSNGQTGLGIQYETDVNNITTAPAEEGVFFLPNGGSYTRLQKPFEITQSDIDNKVNYKVVFAFDPEGLISGSSGGSNENWLSGMVDSTNNYRIDAPFLQIAPVAARENETVMREVYLLRAADNSHDVRVSLYYVKEDADKAIRAATYVTNIYSRVDYPTTFSAVDSIEVTADGKVVLKDWMGNKTVNGLTRATTPGVIGTVTSDACGFGVQITDQGCGGNIQTHEYTAAFVGSGSVDAEIVAGYTAPAPTTTP